MGSRIQIGRLNDEKLLKLRFNQLPLRIEGTPINRFIRMLYRELDEHGIRFKPHIWLSSEFFTPDGVPGFAVPFYLAHPRLMRLERKQMLEVEGGTEEECMRIFRHEAGHALDNAYRLHMKKSWRQTFGPFTKRYPDSYKPKPNSRAYVLHLDGWYAQAHPAEDWAETFAVWLKPGSRWRSRYKDWPAYHKLEYVDRLMKEIAGMPTKNWSRAKDEPLSEIRMTLGEHYRQKRDQYEMEYPSFYDGDLQRIFSSKPRYRSRPTAANFLRGHQTHLRDIISRGTGVHPYTIAHVLNNIIERAKELKMRMAASEHETRQQCMIMLTVHTMNIVHSGRYRFHYGL